MSAQPSYPPFQVATDPEIVNEIAEAIEKGDLLAITEKGVYRTVLYVDEQYVAVAPAEGEKHGWVYTHAYVASQGVR